MRETRTYSEKFRTEAVAMCKRGDRSIRKVAVDLGVNHWTLRDWFRRDAMASGAKKTRDEVVPAKEPLEDKVKRLERENDKLKRDVQRLEIDRDILKKAAMHSSGHRNASAKVAEGVL